MILHNLSPLFSRGKKSDYWVAELGDVQSDQNGFGSVALDSSGNIYVAGGTFSQGAGGRDGLLAKYDTNGNLIWQRILGGANNDIFFSVALDSSGNIYVAGYTFSQGAGGQDGLLTKYDTNGNLIWQRILGGANNDIFFSVALDSSGNIYVAGYTSSQGAGGQDGLLTKYDTNGNLIWQRILGGASFDIFLSVALDSSGNIYVAGYTNSQGAGGHRWFTH
jgi:hypothetical protein